MKYLKVSPRKVRLIANVIRGLDLQEALNKLALLNKRSVRPILKLLESAKANAEHNHSIAKENLFIKEITVDDGPTAFRWMPRAFGRATPIRHRTSYVKLVLSEKEPTEKRLNSKKLKKEEQKKAKKSLISEKVEVDESKPGTDEAKKEIFDVRMKGKHRHMQHQDGKRKKEKGAFKKMFQRKTGV